jgi:hypothetical protein
LIVFSVLLETANLTKLLESPHVLYMIFKHLLMSFKQFSKY